MDFWLTHSTHDLACIHSQLDEAGQTYSQIHVSIKCLVLVLSIPLRTLYQREHPGRLSLTDEVPLRLVFGMDRTRLRRALRRPKCNELLGARHLVVSTASHTAYRRTSRDRESDGASRFIGSQTPVWKYPR